MLAAKMKALLNLKQISAPGSAVIKVRVAESSAEKSLAGSRAAKDICARKRR